MCICQTLGTEGSCSLLLDQRTNPENRSIHDQMLRPNFNSATLRSQGRPSAFTSNHHQVFTGERIAVNSRNANGEGAHSLSNPVQPIQTVLPRAIRCHKRTCHCFPGDLGRCILHLRDTSKSKPAIRQIQRGGGLLALTELQSKPRTRKTGTTHPQGRGKKFTDLYHIS
jgi:hypothetical protein